MVDPISRIRQAIAETIHKHGRQVLGVFGGERPFAYTIGNVLSGYPELLVIGIEGEDSMVLLNEWSAIMIGRGSQFEDRELIDIGWLYPCMAVHCREEVKDLFTVQAGNFYGNNNYRVIQILVPDAAGRFPGTEGCLEPFASVPIYGKRMH